MKPIVYIQANRDGLPYSTNGEVAARGFTYLGYEVHLFVKTDLAKQEITPDTVVVGGMGTVHAALEQIGIRPPLHVTVPAILFPYLGREVWKTTVPQLISANRFPVFVKPYEDNKLFDGCVVHSAEELEELTAARASFPGITENNLIFAQEPVTFLSEWRVFILRGRPVGVSHYKGDLFAFPFAGVLRATLGAYQNAPAGYSADFGITDTGRTLLVEVNDGYALGAMGLAADRYAELLRTRWEEITSKR